jgi:amino acid transporter
MTREEGKLSNPPTERERPELHRSIGPVQLALYGLGSMLGAGIYGLIGKAAGQVGNAVWLAFVVALIAALLTALSYASLGSRYPRAAGAAYVTERAFNLPLLSFVVGLALVCSGLTSVATQSRVFAANLATLFHLDSIPLWWLALGFLLVLAGIVFRGIRESMWVNVLCTLVEASGLILVVAVGISHWGSVDYLEMPPDAADQGEGLVLVQGAVLTFFAFIGFEDTFNVAEECRDPKRTIPLGLILAMSMAAVLYIAVAVTAVSVVPWPELAEAPGPITEVVNRAAPLIPPIVFTGITLFAVANTALVNYVTASRLIYGMADQGLLPLRFGDVHADRRTPHIAIAALFLVAAPLALFGHRRACRGDRSPAPARLYRGEWRPVRPQGTEGRAARLFRDPAHHSSAWRPRLHGPDSGQGRKRRLGGAGHRWRAAGGRGRHLPPAPAEDASRRPRAMIVCG